MSNPVTGHDDSASGGDNAHDPEFDGPPTGPAGAPSGDAPIPGPPQGVEIDGRIDLDESREAGEDSTDQDGGPTIPVPSP